MKSEAAEEAVEAVCAPGGKVITKAVAVHIHAAVLFWERWDSALWVLVAESFVEEDKVGEAAADGGFGFLEGGEVGLLLVSEAPRCDCAHNVHW